MITVRFAEQYSAVKRARVRAALPHIADNGSFTLISGILGDEVTAACSHHEPFHRPNSQAAQYELLTPVRS
jgi:hypothetical protein